MPPSLFPVPPRAPGVVEDDTRRRGFHTIIGTDEAGRGCLAGPVQAAAVALPVELRIPGVDDSKVLTEGARTALEPVVRAAALSWSLDRAPAEEVDRINVLQASLASMTRAVSRVWDEVVAAGISPDGILVVVDGPHRLPSWTACPQRAVVGGDALSVAIAAASILAKVHRDRYMEALAEVVPGYGWERNKGYGTREHRAALAALGVTPHHRRTFGPVAEILGADASPTEPADD
ncbi:MAG: ribonuclease HII [Pseudomonadota bacterium]